MARDLDSDPSGRALDCDVIVIGGGVNGVGVARDASLRGLKVALFERNDIAFGASGNSSGMIHGGPRYLTYDPAHRAAPAVSHPVLDADFQQRATDVAPVAHGV